MRSRTRVASASLAAIAFFLTPSPVALGQANSARHSYHVDQSLVDVSYIANNSIDDLMLAEVERISAIPAR